MSILCNCGFWRQSRELVQPSEMGFHSTSEDDSPWLKAECSWMFMGRLQCAKPTKHNTEEPYRPIASIRISHHHHPKALIPGNSHFHNIHILAFCGPLGASQLWALLPAAWHLCRFFGLPLQPRSFLGLSSDSQSQQTGFSKHWDTRDTLEMALTH